VASRPYSETFIRAYGPQGWWTYVVPAGKRAVVRNVTVVDGIGVSGHTQVEVQGIIVALAIFPASLRFYSIDMRVVAYQGQEIRVFLAVQGIHVCVSGFEFVDDGASTAADGELSYDIGQEGRPAPAPLPDVLF